MDKGRMNDQNRLAGIAAPLVSFKVSVVAVLPPSFVGSLLGGILAVGAALPLSVGGAPSLNGASVGGTDPALLGAALAIEAGAEDNVGAPLAASVGSVLCWVVGSPLAMELGETDATKAGAIAGDTVLGGAVLSLGARVGAVVVPAGSS